MFPFVYGFEWTTGTMVFLGAFFTVLLIIATAVATSTARTLRSVRQGIAEAMHWKESFSLMPAAARRCRHDLLGTVHNRVCANAFCCETCPEHRMYRSREASRKLLPEDRFYSMGGFYLPRDRYYDRGHTWVFPLDDGTYRIGMDDFARRMFPAIPEVALPEKGTKLARGSVAFTLTAGGSAVKVRSPLGGTVIDRGDFWDGWLLHIRPEKGTRTEHLLRGDEIRCWLRDQMEYLQWLVAGRSEQSVLADGGVPVENFADAAPTASWPDIRRALLLDPSMDAGSGTS